MDAASVAAKFVPGDVVQVVPVEWPPGSGRIKPWVGLFSKSGYPRISKPVETNWIARVQNGQVCFVVAAVRTGTLEDRNEAWYYLLVTTHKDNPIMGWSRSKARLMRLNDG